jgi:hypothetical protein
LPAGLQQIDWIENSIKQLAPKLSIYLGKLKS